MSRGLTSDVLAQLSASSLKPFLAMKAEFLEGDVRLWTGYGDISIGSETYTGGGTLLGVSGVEETSEIKATGLNVSLSGVDSSILSIALTANYQNRTFTMYLGMLDEAHQIISNVYQLFQGRMDTISINDSSDTVQFTLTVESRLIDLEKPNETRYTGVEQKRLFAGDLGLDFVADLQDKTINWGGGWDYHYGKVNLMIIFYIKHLICSVFLKNLYNSRLIK